MIDFRYHLVSLIAVFLAVALGIVIGTTQLNGGVLDNLQGQVSSLEQDKRNLEDGTKQLKAQQSAGAAFDTAVAPVLVSGALAGSSVLVVVANDGVSADTVRGITALVSQAGGTLSGTVRLQPEYSDPAMVSTLGSYLSSGGLPAGIQLPASGDAGQLVATLLGDVLMIPRSGTPAGTGAISSVLAGLKALGVLSQDGSQVTPANYALVLTSGDLQGAGADQRTATLVQLAAALDAAGSGAVLAGDSVSAKSTGLVGVVRADPTTSVAVSTVDNVDTINGQISTVLALGQEGAGTSGKYGTGQDAQPVPPLPAATR